MSSFLRFAVEQVLANKGHELKEYVIGVEVFRRAAGYDTRIDPVVRVEARRLRSKLATYYESEGKNDELIIEFPKGSYVPVFRARERVPAVKIAEPEVAAAAGPTIAVMPLGNLSAEPDTVYFSDGLTQELIHLLTKIRGLRVLAWNSALHLHSDPRAIGREFCVHTVLTGTVRRTPDRVRISVQLVDTASGFNLWSETYDRQMQDLFDIQEEIAKSIVNALRSKLMPKEEAVLRATTHNVEAYNLYLKGRFYFNERTAVGLKRSIQLYQEALCLDPNFAMGYAGIADSYTLLGDYQLVEPEDALLKARTAATQALALNPNLGEAEASLGLIRSLFDWEWTDAERHFRRAIELNPSYAAAHYWFALDCLALVGRFEEAQRENEIACELDPFSPLIREGAGYLRMLQGDYHGAIAEYESILEIDPYFYKAYTSSARAYIQIGRYSEAVELLNKGRALAGDVASILGALGQCYAYAGNRAAAIHELEELHAMSGRRYVSSTTFALIHIGLGETDLALDWLEKSVEHRDLTLSVLKVHPAYACLRSEPRFQKILRKLNLV